MSVRTRWSAAGTKASAHSQAAQRASIPGLKAVELERPSAAGGRGGGSGGGRADQPGEPNGGRASLAACPSSVRLSISGLRTAEVAAGSSAPVVVGLSVEHPPRLVRWAPEPGSWDSRRAVAAARRAQWSAWCGSACCRVFLHGTQQYQEPLVAAAARSGGRPAWRWRDPWAVGLHTNAGRLHVRVAQRVPVEGAGEVRGSREPGRRTPACRLRWLAADGSDASGLGGVGPVRDAVSRAAPRRRRSPSPGSSSGHDGFPVCVL